jgi:hypothetical protein
LHVGAPTALLPLQLATPHEVVGPFAYALQLATLLPSQILCAHAVVTSASHAVRAPCGAPTTGVHAPTLPETSHAWHSPPQAWLQHTPSTQ